MRIKALRFLFFGSLILILTGFSHKFYVSLVQVQFNPENKALEITMKIFTDDLEYAISGSKLTYGLGTETEPPQADSVLFNYVKNNFKIKINGQYFSPVYIGKEVEMDVTWIYTEVEGVELINSIEVSDRMLTELFEDQVNLINLKYLGQKKGILLSRNKTSGLIQLKK